ncbi:MAG TPA: hypothetical protein VGU70_19420 [Methylobacterium sp.]|nr:hypothetical protein [Methylobacterium sp.]
MWLAEARRPIGLREVASTGPNPTILARGEGHLGMDRSRLPSGWFDRELVELVSLKSRAELSPRDVPAPEEVIPFPDRPPRFELRRPLKLDTFATYDLTCVFLISDYRTQASTATLPSGE